MANAIECRYIEPISSLQLATSATFGQRIDRSGSSVDAAETDKLAFMTPEITMAEGERSIVPDSNRPPPADESGSAFQSKAGFWVPLGLALILLFSPSGIRYLLGTSSNAPGLILAGAALWGVALVNGSIVRGSNAYRALMIAVPVIIVLVAHLFIAVRLPRIPQNIDFGRAAGSLLSVIILAGTAGIAADWLARAPANRIDRTAGIVRILLVLIGLWSVIGFQPPSPITLWKPSFPFTEPSHFSLVAAPFIIDGCVRSTSRQSLVWLAVWLVFALLNNSLSLVVVIAIAALVSLPIAHMSVMMIASGLVASQLDLQYYFDRLDFSAESDNISSLVYRQGWELISEAIRYSNGWGVGLQQLGFAPLNAPTSNLIYHLTGNDLNLQDGSFLAAKLTSELGIFGMVLVAIFVISLVRAGLSLRALSLQPAYLQNSNVRFALAMICGFSVEVFVRGVGYFSSTLVIFIAALMAQKTLRQISIERAQKS